mmetsp:Transcript_51040/g.165209  ORF Transcript_51040/g.165209 Transcript_51040/m.165209 type:complete len:324 (-) Transcript_51040:746-1717(-)
MLRLAARAPGELLRSERVVAIGLPSGGTVWVVRRRPPKVAADARVLIDTEGADPIPALHAACSLDLVPQLVHSPRRQVSSHFVVLLAAQGIRHNRSNQVHEQVPPIVSHQALGQLAADGGAHRCIGQAAAPLEPRKRHDRAAHDVVRRVAAGVEVRHDLSSSTQLAIKIKERTDGHAAMRQLADLGSPRRISANDGKGTRQTPLAALRAQDRKRARFEVPDQNQQRADVQHRNTGPEWHHGEAQAQLMAVKNITVKNQQTGNKGWNNRCDACAPDYLLGPCGFRKNVLAAAPCQRRGGRYHDCCQAPSHNPCNHNPSNNVAAS